MTAAKVPDTVIRQALQSKGMMEALRKTAAILSQNFGVEVVFRGDQAYTDGKTIVVPAMPDNAPEELIEAVIGFVDHEVGHVRHTDMSEERPFTDPDKRVKILCNGIEDIRQEKLMVADYRGVGLNLERTLIWAINKIEPQWAEMDPFFKFVCACMLRAKIYGGQSFVEPMYKRLVDAKLDGILDQFDDDIRQFDKLPSVSAAYDLTKKMLAKLDELADPPKMGSSGSEKTKGKGKGKGERSEAGDPISGDGEGDEPEDSDEASGAAGEGKGDEPGAFDEADEEGKPGKGDGGDPDKVNVGKRSVTPFTEHMRRDISVIARKSGKTGICHDKSLDEAIGAKLSVELGSVSGYRAYTTEFDRDVEPEGASTAKLSDYNRSRDEVLPYINVVSSVLTRTLIAQARATLQQGRFEGALSVSNIARMRVGQFDVFQKRWPGRKMNTYVELVVDQSGSMTGGKIDLASKTCLVIAEALDKIKIPFGICGFTCGYMDDGLTAEQRRRQEAVFRGMAGRSHHSGTPYERIEPLVEYVYKRAQEPYAMKKVLMPLMCRQEMSNNADGDSLLRIGKRVMTRHEQRKIIIVLSDGHPCAAYKGRNVHHARLKQVVGQLERMPGMEVIGIGINTEAPKEFYKRCVIVDRIDKLPALAMGELKNALMVK